MSSLGDEKPVFNDLKFAIGETGIKTRYVLKVLISGLIGNVPFLPELLSRDQGDAGKVCLWYRV